MPTDKISDRIGSHLSFCALVRLQVRNLKPMPTKPQTSQIVSRKRVADHGEVFTAEREVKAMCDLVKSETERIESRFLEPACGQGAFLVESETVAAVGVLAAQPNFHDVVEAAVLVDLTGIEVAMVVHQRQLFGKIVEQMLCSFGFQQEILIHKCFHRKYYSRSYRDENTTPEQRRGLILQFHHIF